MESPNPSTLSSSGLGPVSDDGGVVVVVVTFVATMRVAWMPIMTSLAVGVGDTPDELNDDGGGGDGVGVSATTTTWEGDGDGGESMTVGVGEGDGDTDDGDADEDEDDEPAGEPTGEGGGARVEMGGRAAAPAESEQRVHTLRGSE